MCKKVEVWVRREGKIPVQGGEKASWPLCTPVARPPHFAAERWVPQPLDSWCTLEEGWWGRRWRLDREELESWTRHACPQKALEQDPEMQRCTGAQLVCSFVRQGRGGQWRGGEPHTCSA